MSGYIDLDYISKIQPRLQQFKKKRDYLYNFRCPVCGDSKKSKTKARAYLYRVKTDMFFKCHNCGIGTSLSNIIKEIDSELYQEYRMERWKSGDTKVKKPKVVKYEYDAPVFRKKSKLEIPVSTLNSEHPAVVYLKGRRLPKITPFSWCDDFAEYIQ